MQSSVLKCLLFLSLFWLHPHHRGSGQQDSTSTMALILASIPPAGLAVGALAQNYSAFWKSGSRSSFHFSNDPPYAIHNDKVGHAYFTSFAADVITLGYEQANMSRGKAAWIGGAVAFGVQLLVELEDGFHSGRNYYGFSPGDAAANLLGASLPILRSTIPGFEAVDLKIEFQPSDALKGGAYSSVLDDNESQFFWLSLDAMRLATGKPFWVNVAIGYGVQNLPDASWLPGRADLKALARWFIALDINPKALPFEGRGWDIVRRLLSHIRIPFPALQVVPDTRIVLPKY